MHIRGTDSAHIQTRPCVSVHIHAYPCIPVQAKIADFGLLKRITEMEGEAKTRVAGTPGYVDPDYRRTQMVTARSDVYW